jgi:hypothetical protein
MYKYRFYTVGNRILCFQQKKKKTIGAGKGKQLKLYTLSVFSLNMEKEIPNRIKGNIHERFCYLSFKNSNIDSVTFSQNPLSSTVLICCCVQ